ncbi:hypothetical protein HDU76_010967 [Blyttiomyces sp. JEL0837]|nr:hypothetical protein HDU76_010967 [Blyttiomyces sp. JEL0837]
MSFTTCYQLPKSIKILPPQSTAIKVSTIQSCISICQHYQYDAYWISPVPKSSSLFCSCSDEDLVDEVLGTDCDPCAQGSDGYFQCQSNDRFLGNAFVGLTLHPPKGDPIHGKTSSIPTSTSTTQHAVSSSTVLAQSSSESFPTPTNTDQGDDTNSGGQIVDSPASSNTPSNTSNSTLLTTSANDVIRTNQATPSTTQHSSTTPSQSSISDGTAPDSLSPSSNTNSVLIAGIGVGILLIILIVFGIWYCISRKNKQQLTQRYDISRRLLDGSPEVQSRTPEMYETNMISPLPRSLTSTSRASSPSPPPSIITEHEIEINDNDTIIAREVPSYSVDVVNVSNSNATIKTPSGVVVRSSTVKSMAADVDYAGY